MARNGKFVIKQSRGGKTRLVLLASNGRVVVTELLARQNSLVAGVQIEQLTLDQAKRLPFDAG